MAGALILLIVGTAAGVGAPALGIWLWVRRGRRGRSATSIRSHHNPGALFDALPDGPGGTANPAMGGATLVVDGRQTERDEKSIPDEISDLARLASAAARSAAEAVVPAALVETAMEADRDLGGEHGQATVAPARTASTELVMCDLDIAGDESRAVPRETTMPALWPADATDIELSADPGPASAGAPVLPDAGAREIASRGVEYEAGTARPSEEAQPPKFAHLNEILEAEAEACGEPAREGDDTIEAIETEGGVECSAAESVPSVGDSAISVAPLGDNLEPEPAIVDALPESIAEDTAGEVANAGEPSRTRPRPSRPAQHRDRRGQRRALPPPAAPASERPPPVEASLRAPAEAKLRLMLHPIRRTATLSAVLARPPGYPDRVVLLLGEGTEVSSYSEDRYDDVDLEWTADLLSGEVRLDCKEGYQWLRSSRRIHLFGEVADEPGLISIGSAALSSPTTIICLREDVAAARAAAEACGSPTLVSHDHWSGIPDGWAVLSGYLPAHAAASGLATGLTGLDPGVGSEILLAGGLRIRSASFAEGSPPRIEIAPFPSGAIVTIDGQPAELGEDGAWRADGWDRPGDHLVDVVPGPSAAYRVIEDPWTKDGWEAWNAHPERFGATPHAPWAVAQVCGAAVLGPGGEYVVAADAKPSVVCLGLRRGAVGLRGRPDAPVAVGLLKEPPAFLISASGPRRSQGRIEWLSPSAPSASIRAIDPHWAAAVRSAASRRLPIDGGGSSAAEAWRRARERARRQRRPRS
jgi:hypothetical protein